MWETLPVMACLLYIAATAEKENGTRRGAGALILSLGLLVPMGVALASIFCIGSKREETVLPLQILQSWRNTGAAPYPGQRMSFSGAKPGMDLHVSNPCSSLLPWRFNSSAGPGDRT